MRNWACARKQGIFPFSFLISHLSFLIFKSFSFVICHFLTLSFFPLFISHFSFVISHLFNREREGDPCIDAQQDDEQGLDGVDNQYEEQGIV